MIGCEGFNSLNIFILCCVFGAGASMNFCVTGTSRPCLPGIVFMCPDKVISGGSVSPICSVL